MNSALLRPLISPKVNIVPIGNSCESIKKLDVDSLRRRMITGKRVEHVVERRYLQPLRYCFQFQELGRLLRIDDGQFQQSAFFVSHALDVRAKESGCVHGGCKDVPRISPVRQSD